MDLKWQERFMAQARMVASWSKDQSTKVGSVIVDPTTRVVLGQGYNGFPRGVDDDVPTRLERPEKYLFIVHAELNAILNAGSPVKGAWLFSTLHPCNECAKAIIQSGIVAVVCPRTTSELAGRWGDSFRAATEMFEEAGVRVIELSGS